MMALRINRAFPTPSLLEGGMGQVLSELWNAPVAQRAAIFPPLNAWEDANHFYVEAEVAGFKLEEIDITLMGDELTIRGKRPVVAVENASYHRRERIAGEFTRTLTLGLPVAAEAVAARLENGVLTITLPKAEAAKARRIQVVAK